MREEHGHTLEVGLEGILGGLEALLGLEPDKAELVLDVVDHDGLTLTTFLLTALGGGVGTLELEVLVGLLHVLAAVALVEDIILQLDVVGVGEDLVTGDDVLWQMLLALSSSSPCIVVGLEKEIFSPRAWSLSPFEVRAGQASPPQTEDQTEKKGNGGEER